MSLASMLGVESSDEESDTTPCTSDRANALDGMEPADFDLEFEIPHNPSDAWGTRYGHRLDDKTWRKTVDAYTSSFIFKLSDDNNKGRTGDSEKDLEDTAIAEEINNETKYRRKATTETRTICGVVPLSKASFTSTNNYVQIWTHRRNIELGEFRDAFRGEFPDKIFGMDGCFVTEGFSEVSVLCNVTSKNYLSHVAHLMYPLPINHDIFNRLFNFVVMNTTMTNNGFEQTVIGTLMMELPMVSTRDVTNKNVEIQRLLDLPANNYEDKRKLFNLVHELLMMYSKVMLEKNTKNVVANSIAFHEEDHEMDEKMLREASYMPTMWATSSRVLYMFGSEKYAYLSKYIDKSWLDGLSFGPMMNESGIADTTRNELDVVYSAFKLNPLNFASSKTIPDIVSRPSNRKCPILTFEKAAQAMADIEGLGPHEVSETLFKLYILVALEEIENIHSHNCVPYDILKAHILNSVSNDILGSRDFESSCLKKRFYKTGVWTGSSSNSPFVSYFTGRVDKTADYAIPHQWVKNNTDERIIAALHDLSRETHRCVYVHDPDHFYFDKKHYATKTPAFKKISNLLIYRSEVHLNEGAMLRAMDEIAKKAIYANEVDGPLPLKHMKKHMEKVCSEQCAFLEMVGARMDGGKPCVPVGPFIVLDGIAGSGKSASLRAFFDMLGKKYCSERVFATNFQNAVVSNFQKMYPHVSAGTLTREIYDHVTCKNAKAFEIFDLDGDQFAMMSKLAIEANKNETYEMCKFSSFEIVIVEELSLVPPDVFSFFLNILARCSNVRLVIFIGDAHQLPCIGRGNLMESVINAFPTVTYYHHHRFRSGALTRAIRAVRDMDMDALRSCGTDDTLKIYNCDRNTFEFAAVNAFNENNLHYGNSIWITFMNFDREKIEQLLRNMYMYESRTLPFGQTLNVVDSGQRVRGNKTVLFLNLTKGNFYRFCSTLQVIAVETAEVEMAKNRKQPVRERETRHATVQQIDTVGTIVRMNPEDESQKFTVVSDSLSGDATRPVKQTMDELMLRSTPRPARVSEVHKPNESCDTDDDSCYSHHSDAGNMWIGGNLAQLPECVYQYPSPSMYKDSFGNDRYIEIQDAVSPKIAAIISGDKNETKLWKLLIVGVEDTLKSQKMQFWYKGRNYQSYPLTLCSNEVETQNDVEPVNPASLEVFPAEGKFRNSIVAGGCSTVHRSQGLEVPTGVFVSHGNNRETNSFIFTALTRGEKMIVIGNWARIMLAASRPDPKRVSMWSELFKMLHERWKKRYTFPEMDYVYPAEFERLEAGKFGVRKTPFSQMVPSSCSCDADRVAVVMSELCKKRKRDAMRESELNLLVTMSFDDIDILEDDSKRRRTDEPE